MKKYEHGGRADVKYDFSANINPLGMPPNVKQAIINSIDNSQKYPDPECRELTEKIAKNEHTKAENIICGNGAADLIYRIVSVIKPHNAVICSPAFSEYEKALYENKCCVRKFSLSPEKDFLCDDTITDALTSDTDMLIMCNPNNPTGKVIPIDLLEKICCMCEKNNIFFLCDECFMDFVKSSRTLTAGRFINNRVIILKAFTKIYAIPGIRLGYAVFGSSSLLKDVRRRGQFWPVSSIAQAAGIAALQEKDFINKTVELIEKERRFLTESFRELGLRVFGSDANFILFYCGLPLDKILIQKGIAIRNCENFDCLGKGYFRIAVRSHGENLTLIKALKECING